MQRVVLVGLPGSGVTTLSTRLDTACRLGDEDWHSLSFVAGPRPGDAPQAWLDMNHVDAAVLVVSCVQGADARVSQAFMALAERGLPVIIVQTFIDSPGTDPDQVTGIIEHLLGESAQVSCDHRVLLDDDEHAIGFISLIDGGIVEWTSGMPTWVEPDDAHLEAIAEESEGLVESIVLSATDDELFADWESGADLDAGDLGAEYAAQTRAGVRHPVLYAGAHPRGLGDALILDLLSAVLAEAETAN